ncbi:MAG: hypothetical protein IOMNBAOH_01616 [Rhodocyclaceae bacterium]|nr:hypothetical protein [Rhodocyclaceae bacterium]
MNRHETVATMLGRTSLIIATLVSTAVNAQITAKGFATKPMLVAPISGVEGKEIVLLDVAMDPGASSPRHTHPGDCYGAILEGTVELVVEGQDPRRFTAGQAWHNPRGPIHYFRNVGTSPARLQNTLVVDQGKPRTVTQPQ